MSLLTGKDCALSVGGKVYDTVTNRFELAFTSQALEYQTLAGPAAGPGSETGTLSIAFANDSNETDSLFQALWTATDSGTPIAYVATVGTKTYSGSAVAARPNIVGEAGAVSEVTVELTLDGIPTPGVVTPLAAPSK